MLPITIMMLMFDIGNYNNIIDMYKLVTTSIKQYKKKLALKNTYAFKYDLEV